MRMTITAAWQRQFTKEQFLVAKSIEEMLDAMSERKELWSEDALLASKEWEECRKKGRLLLSMLV